MYNKYNDLHILYQVIQEISVILAIRRSLKFLPNSIKLGSKYQGIFGYKKLHKWKYIIISPSQVCFSYFHLFYCMEEWKPYLW